MALIFTPGAQFFDSNGSPVASGSLTFYDSGTTNKRAVYTDSAMTVEASNPYSLDSSGRISQNIYGEGTYTIVLKTSAGATVWSRDEVYGWSDGTPYYARTAAEISAGVTPTAYQYPPGDVRRYGVALDGTTDNSAAWTEACSIGISLYVAEGTTLVDPDSIALKSGVRLYGDGPSSVIKLRSGGKCIKNENWNTTTQDENIIIENLTIDGGNFTGVAIPTISLKHVRNTHVRNIVVKDAATQAILIAGFFSGGTHYPSEYCTVENCVVDGTNGVGIGFFGECKYCKSIGNLVIDHKDDAFPFDAEASAECFGNSSIGDTCYNGPENDPAAGGRGLLLGGQINFVCTGFSAKDSASSGIVLGYGSGGSTNCKDVVINGFSVVNAGTLDSDDDSIGYGVNIGRVDGLTLSDGRVIGSQDNGVQVASTSTKITIDNVTAASNGGYGINITANGTSVSDCDCYENANHGIFINNADYCEIVGNTCFDNAGDGINAASSDYIQINHNHCYDSGGADQLNGIVIENCDRCDSSWNYCHNNVTEQFVPQAFPSGTSSDYLTARGNIIDAGAALKGSATITAGNANVTVTNGNVMLGSVITIVPTNAAAAEQVASSAGVYVGKLNKTSFTITASGVVPSDCTFDWMIT